MFVDALKGQIQSRLERNTSHSRATLSAPEKPHKPSNIMAYRAIWGVLWCTLEQVWLGSLVGR